MAWCTVGRKQICSKPGSIKVQIEAMHKARDIFPNLNGSEAEDYVEGSMEDPDAFWEGEGFMDGGEEDEWEDWVGNEAL